MEQSRSVTHVGVVGYGYWGAKHVRVLMSIPDVAVTVIDANDDRLAEAASHFPAVRTSTDLDEVLDELSAVLIATPPGSHFELAHRAIAAGKHVLVEKPLTTSVEDAERLVDLAAQRGVQIMVGHTFEYNPAVWKLREVVRSGALGRVLYVNTERLSLGRYQSDVNVVWDLAPHDISIVSFVLDEMPSATAVWAHNNMGGRHADVAHLRLEFPLSQIQAYVHVSWLSPNKVRRVTVVGEEKMAVYDDMSDNERIRIYDIGVDVHAIDDPSSPPGLPVTYRTGDIISPYIAFSEPLLLQDTHFVECVRTGRTPDTPGERGLDIVRVLTEADQATVVSAAAARTLGSVRQADDPSSTDHSLDRLQVS